jgi:hypothetical protein
MAKTASAVRRIWVVLDRIMTGTFYPDSDRPAQLAEINSSRRDFTRVLKGSFASGLTSKRPQPVGEVETSGSRMDKLRTALQDIQIRLRIPMTTMLGSGSFTGAISLAKESVERGEQFRLEADENTRGSLAKFVGESNVPRAIEVLGSMVQFVATHPARFFEGGDVSSIELVQGGAEVLVNGLRRNIDVLSSMLGLSDKDILEELQLASTKLEQVFPRNSSNTVLPSVVTAKGAGTSARVLDLPSYSRMNIRQRLLFAYMVKSAIIRVFGVLSSAAAGKPGVHSSR